MSAYEIIFPLLILVAVGIAVVIITRHFPEAVKKKTSPVTEEKKRWRKVFLGKWEGLLRYVRLLILKIDNKLSGVIKNIRSQKDKVGKSLKDYRGKQKDKQDEISKEVSEISKPSDPFEARTSGSKKPENIFKKRSEISEQTILDRKEEFSAAAPSRKIYKPEPKVAQEIVKTAPTVRKIDKEGYWNRKEEMLLQSITIDPQNVSLYLQLGRLYFNKHNWQDAYNSFQEALRLDSNNVKAKEELKRASRYLKK